jgi:oligopeptide transport system permease protein
MSATTSTSPSQIAALGLSRPSKSLTRDAIERLFKNKASVAGLVIIVVFLLIATFAPFIAPMNPLEIHSGANYLPAAWEKKEAVGKFGDWKYVLGTDNIGRDILSRTIAGTRVSMTVGFVPTLIILLIGTTVGMVSGFMGGGVDTVLMRLTDIIYAFPDLLLFIIVMVSLRETPIGQAFGGLLLLFACFAVVNWVGLARLVRGQVLSLKEKEFVEAARCIGANNVRIMFRHILPNCVGVIVVYAAFRIPAIIITEAILGYLGVGMRPATNPDAIFITSWGALMLDGQAALNTQPWILLAPAICVALVVLAFTFLGDGLRDALDPRMRGTK